MLTIREVIKICFNALLQRLKKHRGNWEQNDPTADDYIKNRPFYTDETNHTIILPEQTLSSLEVTLKEPLIIGETYVVTFNGMDYKCVCRDYDGYRMLGNNAIYEYDGDITTDTGEPFALEAAGDSKNIFFYLKNESEASTVKIGKAKVVKLDKKYLPDLGLAPVATSGNYNDLENKPTIYTDVVRYNTSQSLSTARKGTAKMNIGAVGYDSAQSLTTTNKAQARINIGAVGYEAQTLTNAQKTQARTNIGAVGYEAQTLTATQKTQARTNIGAVAVNDLATVATSGSYDDLKNKPIIYNDVVRYNSVQSLSDSQKMQARTNIGAGDGDYNSLKNRPCSHDINDTFIWSAGSITSLNVGPMLYYKHFPTYSDYSALMNYKDDSLTFAMRYPSSNDEFVEFGYSGEYWLNSNAATNLSCWGNPWLAVKYTGNHLYDNFNDASGQTNNYLSKAQLDNGIPFCFCLDNQSGLWTGVQNGGLLFVSEATISSGMVYTRTKTLNQLDEKFIPDTIARVEDIKDELIIPRNTISLIDQVNGFIYYVSIRNGTLVSSCAVKRITIASMPNKVEYVASEDFDSTGLTIMATRYDGTMFEVTDFTYDAPSPLTEDVTSIPVTYTDMGVTYTVDVPITVNPFDPEVILMDFEYTDNGDGTYTITGWKGTHNGEASTEMIIPNYSCIIV